MSALTHQCVSDATSPCRPPQGPKLLDRLRLALETRRFRPESVGRFVEWNRQYILFHKMRHPETMGRTEIETFLAELAARGYGAELQAQARQALAFLYREILGIALPWPEIARPRRETSDGRGQQPPKLLDRARAVLRARHYSLRTEECYVEWMRRYILHHNKRHPLEMGALEIEEFLTSPWKGVLEGDILEGWKGTGWKGTFYFTRVIQNVPFFLPSPFSFLEES
jgi:hypothetical protein